MHDCWWKPFHLDKMSNYYIMPCSPGGLICNQRISQMGKYDFEMKWERSIRGHNFYRQRYWKGKWKH